jgi:biopolymer transport protein ExbD
MRYASQEGAPPAKPEMTPMIDMTFQLIAFFMVVINFSQADQNERIKLPLSELAKPPEVAPVVPITLQLTEEGTVILGAKEVTVPQLGEELLLEKQVLVRTGKRTAKDVTIVIRADRTAPAGEVQELIQICQTEALGFEKFVLRAKQEST